MTSTPETPDGPRASRPRRTTITRLRRLLTLATDSWLARVYLGVCAASVPAVFLFPDSFFASAPLLLTAPLSFASIVIPFGPGTQGGGAVEVLAIGFWIGWLLLCVLVNAAVLGALAARSAPTAPADEQESPSRSRPRLRRVRDLLAPAVDNWPARGYLAVVAAALGFFLYAVYLSPDPGFAGIWPFMATAPLSILAFLLAEPVAYSSPDWLHPLVFSAGVVLAGLFNAVLLGLLAHRLSARDPHLAT